MILTFGDELLTNTVSILCPRCFATTPDVICLERAVLKVQVPRLSTLPTRQRPPRQRPRSDGQTGSNLRRLSAVSRRDEMRFAQQRCFVN